jgi:hypothetical protein
MPTLGPKLKIEKSAIFTPLNLPNPQPHSPFIFPPSLLRRHPPTPSDPDFSIKSSFDVCQRVRSSSTPPPLHSSTPLAAAATSRRRRGRCSASAGSSCARGGASTLTFFSKAWIGWVAEIHCIRAASAIHKPQAIQLTPSPLSSALCCYKRNIYTA